MPEDLFTFSDKPESSYLLAGWRRQWSNGGRISSGLPRYLIEKNGGRQVGQFSEYVNRMCYPFQVAGTHDAFRPSAAFNEGLPSVAMSRQNSFYEIGSGLIVFLGEEPWYRLDIYSEAFFSAIKELGIEQTVAVEGVNGPAPPDLERRITCVYSRRKCANSWSAMASSSVATAAEVVRARPSVWLSFPWPTTSTPRSRCSGWAPWLPCTPS